MPKIPFPVSSAPGMKPQEGSGRLKNGFASQAEQGARFPVIWHRCAGMNQVIDLSGSTHTRGFIIEDSNLLVVLDDRVHVVTVAANTFSSINLGTVAGTTPVTIAKNNAATPNIVAVTENGAINLFVDAAPTSFADGDLPQPNSVAELNGYLLFTIGDGRIFATDLNAVTVNSLSFTTEQSLGGLLRGVQHKGEFFAFGRTGTGVYKDAGTSPFPLARQFALQQGIVGTHAVAGWEEGWVGQLIWVAEDGLVYRLTGYTPEPISSDDVTREIAASMRAGRGELLEASVYMQGRHAFWRLTDPGFWTWEYNATTGNWNQRESYDRDDQRAACSVRAFDRWIVGDRVDGRLYEIDDTYYREGNDPLIWSLRSGPTAAFPSRLGIPRADFDFTAATGLASGEDPVQSDPKVQIRWSKDGGHSFSDPVVRGLGGEGVSDKRVNVLRLGSATGKGMVFELTVSDPVHVGFMGGVVAVEQRAE